MNRFKKGISLLLVAVMILPLGTFAFGEETDILGHWAKEEIQYLIGKEVVSGYSDGNFRPDQSITRAEFIKIINNIFGYSEKAEAKFGDVKEGDWFYDEIRKATKAGYIGGYNDGTIKPNNPITRQEVSKIMGMVFDLDETKSKSANNFADSSKIGDWAKGYVSILKDKGYISGYSDNTFRPTNPITRAEAVKIITNASGNIINLAGEYSDDAAGNVLVNTSNVELKDMKIKGDLYLVEGIGEGDIILDNVVVEGSTYVRGGGENIIIIRHSKLGEIVINKDAGDIRVVLEGETIIEYIAIESGTKLVVKEGVKVDSIKVTEKSNIEIEKGAEIGKVEVEARDTEIKAKGKIESIVSKEDVKVNDEVVGKGKEVKVEDGKVTEVKKDKPKPEPASSAGDGRDRRDDKDDEVAVTGVSVSPKTMTLTVGKRGKITATVKPDNATNKKVNWTTSDESIATVANGVVTAKAAGTATITATSDANSSKKDSCVVTVKAEEELVSAISVDKEELTLPVGATETLTVTFDPTNASNKTLIWTSSNADVATVAGGVVTAVSEGTATITATSNNGKTATTTVTVVAANTVAMIGTTQYDSLADAIEATQEGDTVKLVADVELTSSGLTIGTDKEVTFDLAGHVLSGVLDNEGASALITNNGSLTIEDTSAEKTGKITNQAENPDNEWEAGFPAYANNTITNSGNLIIDGGRIENTTDGRGASYVIDNNSGNRDAVVIVNEGHIINPNGNFAIRQFANSTVNKNSVTINGGIVEGTRAVWIQLPGSSGQEKLAELTVNGGTLKSTDKGEGGYNLAVYSYTFGDSFAKTKITITGGTFDGDVALTGGSPKAPMETVEVSNEAIFLGQRGVFSYANVVNETQNNGYTTIQAAIDDATAGDTILVAEGTYLESLTIPSGKEGLVLKSVSGADATVINGNIALGADNITIEGFTIGNSGARNGYVGLERTSGSKIINNIINGSKATVSIGNTTGNTVDSVTIEGNIINGGTIGLYPTSGSTITISNNTINSGNGEIIWIHGAEFKPTSLTLDIQGNIAIQEGDVITIHFKPVSINGVVDELDMISTIRNDNEPVEVVLGWVKTVGATDADFTTIQAAINEAAAGDVIIVGDGEYTENLTINKAITLKSLNGRESTEIAGTITITADDVTVEGFTVTAQGYYEVPVIHMINVADVNILNNTVVADDTAYGAIGTSTGPAKVTGIISGNTVTGMIIVGTDGDLEVSDNNVTLTTASTEGICFYPVGSAAVITVTGNTVGQVTEGNVQIKVNEKPLSVNGETNEVDMLAAITADNNEATAKLSWVSYVSSGEELITELGKATIKMIILENDINDLDSALDIERDVTIDGEGNSINAGININNGAEVEIKNLAVENVENRVSTLSSPGENIIIGVRSGTLTADNITIRDSRELNRVNLVGISVQPDQTLKLTDSTLVLSDTDDSNVYGVYVQVNGIAEISNNSINLEGRNAFAVGVGLSSEVNNDVSLSGNTLQENSAGRDEYMILVYTGTAIEEADLYSWVDTLIDTESGERAYINNGSGYYAYPNDAKQETINEEEIEESGQGEEPEDEEEPEELDIAPLDAAIEEAIAAKEGIVVSEDGTDVPAGTYWVAQADMDTLDEAIAAAEADKETAETQQDVAEAVEALEAAVSTFNDAKQEVIDEEEIGVPGEGEESVQAEEPAEDEKSVEDEEAVEGEEQEE